MRTNGRKALDISVNYKFDTFNSRLNGNGLLVIFRPSSKSTLGIFI
jgi:hypothetical protein